MDQQLRQEFLAKRQRPTNVSLRRSYFISDCNKAFWIVKCLNNGVKDSASGPNGTVLIYMQVKQDLKQNCQLVSNWEYL